MANKYLPTLEIDYLINFYKKIHDALIRILNTLENCLPQSICKEILSLIDAGKIDEESICNPQDAKEIILELLESNNKLLKMIKLLQQNDFRKFFGEVRNLIERIFANYGKTKGHIFGRAYGALINFEYQPEVLEEIRDHIIHSFNVYLLGLIINLYLFVVRSSPTIDLTFVFRNKNSRLNNNLEKIPLILPLEFSWILASILHDIGYIYEKEYLLRKIFPHYYEFINISDPGILMPTLDDIFDYYGNVVLNNATIAYRLEIDESSRKNYIKVFKQRIRSSMYEALISRSNIHGAISAYITIKSALWMNDFSMNYYWPLIYYEAIMASVFAQLYHSMINNNKLAYKTPLVPRELPNRKVVKTMSAYSYIPLLLIIIDEIIDFGRPTLRKNKNGNHASNWHLDDIAIEENKIILSIKNNAENSEDFFTKIKDKLISIGVKCNKITLIGLPFLEKYIDNDLFYCIEIIIEKIDRKTTKIAFSING